MAPLTVESVKSMKVQELRDELKGRGLSATGVKADLVKRLEDSLSNQANGEEKEAPADEEVKEDTKVMVEVDGDAPQEVVEAAAEAAVEAAEEVVREAVAKEGEEEAAADEEPAVKEEAAATEDAAPAEVDANGDATETEAAQAMDTAEGGAPAEDNAEKENDENVDTIMEEPSAADDGSRPSGHRLFVGCIPTKLTEDELKKHFDEMGSVKDVSILRDTLGVSKGCAFVTYEELAHAEEAIASLDKKIKLPGATSHIEVRFARENNKVQPTTEPNDKNMLFFARAPPKATEEDIKTAFAEHGEVKEVQLFHNTKATGGASKGCGFVYFVEQESAIAAISGMHEKVTLTGGFSPLTVKWADPNLTEKKRKAAEVTEVRNSHDDNTEIFFARIPRTTDEAALTEVFAQAGKVKSLVLFKVNKEANTSKGCGIVTYESHEEAANALETLNESHTFPPMDKSMVLKWVDHDLQDAKKRKVGPGGFMGGPGFGGMGQQPMVEEERPPQGCAPDAFKLYMVGVPKSWDVAELKEALTPHGTVVEANIVRNRETKEPRGVAFAWMKTRAQGERAIKEFTKQGEGQQDAMKVSRAKPRGRVGMGMGSPGFGPPMSMGPRGGGFAGRPGGFQPRMQGGYNAVRSPASYGPRPVSSYGPRPASSYGPRAQGGYAARPQYQQGSSAYYPPSAGQGQNTSQYSYARQQPQQQQGGGYNYQPQQQQQQGGGGYNYQQPAPAYQPAPTGYPAPAAQGYQSPAQGYQAPYNPPAQHGYRPPADPQAVSAYGTAQVYEPQGAYGVTQQYGTPEAQGGYNYQQPDPTPSAAAAAGQYGAPAAYNPPQGYAAPTEGYNYGQR